jgi:hypothetical protein
LGPNGLLAKKPPEKRLIHGLLAQESAMAELRSTFCNKFRDPSMPEIILRALTDFTPVRI